MPEFVPVAEQKYTMALRWHIKSQDKKTIKRVLFNIALLKEQKQK